MDGISQIETNNKINTSKITKETIDKLHSWICYHSQVINSAFSEGEGHVNTKYHTIHGAIKTEVNYSN